MRTTLWLGSVGLFLPLAAQPPVQWPEGKRVAVSLSFDDARASQLDLGLPLFDRHGARVTFYINPPNAEKRLSAWRQAAAKGYEIGNHTNSHPCSGNFPWSRANALEAYTPALMEKELDSAIADTERLLGVRPITFAYPCGQKFVGRGEETASYVPLVARRFLAGRGFRDEAANDPATCDLAQLFGLESDGLSFDQMKNAVLEARKDGGWLVFAGHDIGAAGPQTTQLAALEAFLKFARDPANGIWLETVASVARYVRDRRGGR